MRDYQLKPHDAAPQGTVTFEIIGNGAKKIAASNGTKPAKPKPQLPRGRQKGSTSKGWTTATKRTVRERLEENRESFQSLAHLTVGEGFPRDPRKLKLLAEKLTRWLRKNFPLYFWVIEFSERSHAPHFHVPLTEKVTPKKRAHFEQYWRSVSENGILTWDPRPDEPIITIARYAAKSHTKENPDWFMVAPFRPFRTNIPKKERERVTVPIADAEKAGLLKYQFTHDGKTKLGQYLAEKAETSELCHIHGTPDNHDTPPAPNSPDNHDIGAKALPPDNHDIPAPQAVPSSLDNHDIAPTSYTLPTRAKLMANSCYTCWHRSGIYLSKLGEQCDRCGETWRPATD